MKTAGIKIANAAAEGYQPDGSMLTEKDYATGHIRTQRSWWEQAETVVGYLNAFELTGDESYLKRSLKCWEYKRRILSTQKTVAGSAMFQNRECRVATREGSGSALIITEECAWR